MSLRESGVYAVRDDLPFRVAFPDQHRAVPYEFAGDPHTSGAVDLADLQRLEKVTTIANWNDVPVTITRVTASMLAWVTLHDAQTARELNLYGGVERGWATAVPLFELDDLHEIVVDLLADQP